MHKERKHYFYRWCRESGKLPYRRWYLVWLLKYMQEFMRSLWLGKHLMWGDGMWTAEVCSSVISDENRVSLARPDRSCNRRRCRAVRPCRGVWTSSREQWGDFGVLRTVMCSNRLFRKMSLTAKWIVDSGRGKNLPTLKSERPFSILFQYSEINYESLSESSGWGNREDRGQNSI